MNKQEKDKGDSLLKIAFLGWGSLIWNPDCLQISGIWKKDGPFLPIEFSRISKDGRLTLVLCSDVSDIQTLWIYANCSCLHQAIDSLRKREKTASENIGFISIPDNDSRCNTVPSVLPRVKSWMDEKEVDAVVWTDLQSNFEDKTRMEFNEDNVVRYLRELAVKNPQAFCDAEEYVRKTPMQVETKIRKRLKREFGWENIIPQSS